MTESEVDKMMRVRFLTVIPLDKSSKEKQHDIKNGISRIGGFGRIPCYPSAYVKAAEILIKEAKEDNQLDELGLPILYLQRHTLELCIKEVLEGLYDVSDCRHGEEVISKGQRKRLKGEHKLGPLKEDLKKTCADLEYEFDTTNLEELVSQIEKCETSLAKCKASPTVTRYSKSPSGGAYLPEEVLIPIVAIQENLEKVAKDIGVIGNQGSFLLQKLSMDPCLRARDL